MASQPGAVTARPFDAGQGDGPEPAQPAQQAGIASWGWPGTPGRWFSPLTDGRSATRRVCGTTAAAVSGTPRCGRALRFGWQQGRRRCVPRLPSRSTRPRGRTRDTHASATPRCAGALAAEPARRAGTGGRAPQSPPPARGGSGRPTSSRSAGRSRFPRFDAVHRERERRGHLVARPTGHAAHQGVEDCPVVVGVRSDPQPGQFAVKGPAVFRGSVGSDDAQPSALDGDPPDLVVALPVREQRDVNVMGDGPVAGIGANGPA